MLNKLIAHKVFAAYPIYSEESYRNIMAHLAQCDLVLMATRKVQPVEGLYFAGTNGVIGQIAGTISLGKYFTADDLTRGGAAGLINIKLYQEVARYRQGAKLGDNAIAELVAIYKAALAELGGTSRGEDVSLDVLEVELEIIVNELLYHVRARTDEARLRRRITQAVGTGLADKGPVDLGAARAENGEQLLSAIGDLVNELNPAPSEEETLAGWARVADGSGDERHVYERGSTEHSVRGILTDREALMARHGLAPLPKGMQPIPVEAYAAVDRLVTEGTEYTGLLPDQHWLLTGKTLREGVEVDLSNQEVVERGDPVITAMALIRNWTNHETLQLTNPDGLLDGLLTLGLLGGGMAGITDVIAKTKQLIQPPPLDAVFDPTKFYPMDPQHWLYTTDLTEAAPMKLLTPGNHTGRAELVLGIMEGLRYALATVTDNGKADVFDADRIVQLAVIAILGYNTDTGLPVTHSIASVKRPAFNWGIVTGDALPPVAVPNTGVEDGLLVALKGFCESIGVVLQDDTDPEPEGHHITHPTNWPEKVQTALKKYNLVIYVRDDSILSLDELGALGANQGYILVSPGSEDPALTINNMSFDEEEVRRSLYYWNKELAQPRPVGGVRIAKILEFARSVDGKAVPKQDKGPDGYTEVDTAKLASPISALYHGMGWKLFVKKDSIWGETALIDYGRSRNWLLVPNHGLRPDPKLIVPMHQLSPEIKMSLYLRNEVFVRIPAKDMVEKVEQQDGQYKDLLGNAATKQDLVMYAKANGWAVMSVDEWSNTQPELETIDVNANDIPAEIRNGLVLGKCVFVIPAAEHQHQDREIPALYPVSKEDREVLSTDTHMWLASHPQAVVVHRKSAWEDYIPYGDYAVIPSVIKAGLTRRGMALVYTEKGEPVLKGENYTKPEPTLVPFDKLDGKVLKEWFAKNGEGLAVGENTKLIGHFQTAGQEVPTHIHQKLHIKGLVALKLHKGKLIRRK